MNQRKSNKLLLLRLIKEKKNILFGSFSDTLTKVDKMREWKYVQKYAVSLGLLEPFRNWMYMRDVFWQNIKKCTIAKIDYEKRMGRARKSKLTKIDDCVLDIIKKDLTLHDSRDIPEISITENSQRINLQSSDQPAGNKRKYVDETYYENVRQQKKLDLQMQYLQLKNYKTELEILKLERELGIGKSSFTLHTVAEDETDNCENGEELEEDVELPRVCKYQ